MHNQRRADRMARRSVGELKRIVDAGTLSSAAACYALRLRGIVYPVDMGRW